MVEAEHNPENIIVSSVINYPTFQIEIVHDKIEYLLIAVVTACRRILAMLSMAAFEGYNVVNITIVAKEPPIGKIKIIVVDIEANIVASKVIEVIN
ncbi:hypothetical protein EGT74_06420 [Chitinophaga lutea]|uniref:Uncharacterized protein n=1 Tax=Chitinophaga lutea TaxID=2488634 RepID=A0A3N4Q6K6_9BACT|nr:hypothetical protein [Chitinophaga lutea]RPE13161.1 hypothetical protein EGT74_06420 [Chitinophaga lutea]